MIEISGRRHLAWLGTESGYRPLRADLGTLNGYREVSRHRRREVVKITLGTGMQARDQFRAALADRGMGYKTVTEIPFEIELVGTGSVRNMFDGCSLLVSAPPMNTSSVTDMRAMFNGCAALTTVPAMNTSSVTDMGFMFRYCSALTDGNVRLIGRHPNVYTISMIDGSGLTREPFYDTNGNPI